MTGPTLTWLNERELYLGSLYVGEVMRMVPEKWREWDWLREPSTDKPIEENRVRKVAYYEAHEAKPWRCWIMSEPDGEQLGEFVATELEAKRMLCEAVMKAASYNPAPPEKIVPYEGGNASGWTGTDATNPWR